MSATGAPVAADDLRRREAALVERLRHLPSLVVAYSGGVDSAYLAWVAHADARPSRALRHRRQPELSGAPSRDGAAIAARLRPAPRDHRHRRAVAARVPGQSRRSLLPLQARALHRARGARAARAASPPSPTATTPTIAATTGRAAAPPASSASSARSTTRVSPRTTSARSRTKPACRPGTSRRPPACRRAFRISRKSPTRSWRRSSRPKTRCARSASACSASAITATSRASSSGATRWRARSSRRSPRPSTPRCRASGFKYVTLDLKGYRLGSLNEGLRLTPTIG